MSISWRPSCDNCRQMERRREGWMEKEGKSLVIKARWRLNQRKWERACRWRNAMQEIWAIEAKWNKEREEVFCFRTKWSICWGVLWLRGRSLFCPWDVSILKVWAHSWPHVQLVGALQILVLQKCVFFKPLTCLRWCWRGHDWYFSPHEKNISKGAFEKFELLQQNWMRDNKGAAKFYWKRLQPR